MGTGAGGSSAEKTISKLTETTQRSHRVPSASINDCSAKSRLPIMALTAFRETTLRE